jgi:pimeloyl-ACP methyl ester carboxylesterase
MLVVRDHSGELHGQPLFWRSSQGPDPAESPTLFVHGVPTSSDDWVPFLERVGGIAPDLPGFGRSGKRGDGDFTMEGYDRFLEDFLDLIDVERVNLVVHDWGAVGLLWAQRFPERVGRIVVLNAVPLGQEYRWHLLARIWRRRGWGELAMGSTAKWVVALLLRPATPRKGGMPKAFVAEIAAHLDQGTQRAILHLYRTSPPAKLLAAGSELGRLRGPALVLWGDEDPYISPVHGERYADLLGGTVTHVPAAGHWPWLDDPSVIDATCDFVRASSS